MRLFGMGMVRCDYAKNVISHVLAIRAPFYVHLLPFLCDISGFR